MILLIVESAKKAREIQTTLGSQYRVQASIGHFRDLPQRDLGVDLSTFQPAYEIQNRKVVSTLRGLAKQADKVILATDLDREGEAIAWHLQQVLGLRSPDRITYCEVSKKAILEALQNPRKVDVPMVRAQEARRVLDRLVGYRVSPALPYGQTAGRVQSPTLRLVVDRELEIKSFKPTDHFAVVAHTGQWAATWDFSKLLPEDAEEKLWLDRQVADQVAQTTRIRVLGTEQTQRARKPSPPLTTSAMQQLASTKLRISPEETMKLAQSLFESGAITYHRTDSFNLSDEALESIRGWLTDSNHPVTDQPRKWKAKAGAQEAHEAIRPVEISKLNVSADDKANQLYSLIRAHTLATQMPDAIYDVSLAALESTTVRVGPNDEPARFNAKGERLIQQGFLAIYDDSDEEEDDADEEEPAPPLPPMSAGDEFDCQCQLQAKKTRPPSRYTEASIIRKLERMGIGRPSTYAAILKNLKGRKFMKVEKRKLVPTELGVTLVKTLLGGKLSFMDYKFTKVLEGMLDQIANSGDGADQAYFKVVSAANERLDSEISRLPTVPKKEVVISETHKCPDCGSPVAQRSSESGTFWGCTKYPGCKGAIFPELPIAKGVECPDCQGKMHERIAKRSKKKFYSCAAYPKCNGVMWPDSPKVDALHGDGEQCPECKKGVMRTRLIRKGKSKGKRFLGCDAYKDGCQHAVWPDASAA